MQRSFKRTIGLLVHFDSSQNSYTAFILMIFNDNGNDMLTFRGKNITNCEKVT